MIVTVAKLIESLHGMPQDAPVVCQTGKYYGEPSISTEYLWPLQDHSDVFVDAKEIDARAKLCAVFR